VDISLVNVYVEIISDCRLTRILERPPEIFSLMESYQFGEVQTFTPWLAPV